MSPERCTHPKDSRSLHHGYDVVCGQCGATVGRVALFPCAVLTSDEADAALAAIGDTAASARLRDAVARLRDGAGLQA